MVLNLVYKNQKSSKEILANPRYKGKVTRCLNGINHLQARKKRMIELCSQKEEYPYMTPAYKDRGALPARSNSLLCSPFSLSLPLTLFPLLEECLPSCRMAPAVAAAIADQQFCISIHLVNRNYFASNNGGGLGYVCRNLWGHAKPFSLSIFDIKHF